jgi:hypothetical protein
MGTGEDVGWKIFAAAVTSFSRRYPVTYTPDPERCTEVSLTILKLKLLQANTEYYDL